MFDFNNKLFECLQNKNTMNNNVIKSKQLCTTVCLSVYL